MSLYCSHCGRDVLPKPGDICPSCNQVIDPAAAEAAARQPPTSVADAKLNQDPIIRHGMRLPLLIIAAVFGVATIAIGAIHLFDVWSTPWGGYSDMMGGPGVLTNKALVELGHIVHDRQMIETYQARMNSSHVSRVLHTLLALGLMAAGWLASRWAIRKRKLNHSTEHP